MPTRLVTEAGVWPNQHNLWALDADWSVVCLSTYSFIKRGLSINPVDWTNRQRASECADLPLQSPPTVPVTRPLCSEVTSRFCQLFASWFFFIFARSRIYVFVKGTAAFQFVWFQFGLVWNRTDRVRVYCTESRQRSCRWRLEHCALASE